MPGIIATLEADWADTIARDETQPAASRVPLWIAREPALEGLTSLRHIESSDAVLLALLRLSQGDADHQPEEQAGMAILQMMLGKIVKLAASTRGDVYSGAPRPVQFEERAQDVISAMWETISEYPTERVTDGVAGRLAMDTLWKATRGSRRHGVELPLNPDTVLWLADEITAGNTISKDTLELLAPSVDSDADPTRPAVVGCASGSSTTPPPPSTSNDSADPSDAPPNGGVEQILEWAQALGVIKPESTQLLRRAYGLDPDFPAGITNDSDAESIGLTYDKVRKRVARTTTAIATAIAESAHPQLTSPTRRVGLSNAILDWAASAQVITVDDADLLRGIYGLDPTRALSQVDAAKQLGIATASVRKRCSRAIRRITAAVQNDSTAVPATTLPSLPALNDRRTA